ncbi:cysteine-rich motor neuron 1 protein-like protein [Leptotrombidium deliense]|uniref:Cysteine-rich motor neuron 1 protein-like protein n=1 Tax=Leptotrombidium deliense TaxID=299467 RepID=A0A443STZ9_9ACAR|nr:cysteine-rich motor neuron 1 protein-like protein [Leptotrombidium deliense]
MCECNPVLTDNCLSIETCEKHCLNGYHLSTSGCSSCYCMSCRNITQTEPKCDKMCANGFKQDEHGCYLCECNVTPAIGNNSDNCAVNGLTYMQNEQWNVHCRKCKCLKGKQICKDIVCTQQVCENLLLRNCCSMCNASRLSVKSLCDSELMKHELHNLVDKCLNCTCEKDSNLYCELNYCPVAACETPVTNGPNCCPYCNNSNATKYEQLNSKSCVWKGKWYADGGQWRNSVCESCMCRDGIPFCFREHCYSLNNTCKHVIKVKNRCCPLCLDTELQNEHCEHNNQVYEHGKHWTLDSCWNCYCYHNRRICYNHCDHHNSNQENEQCCKEHTRQANILHLTTILLTSLASLLMLFTLLSCILKRQPQFGLSKILWPSTTSTATHTTDGNHDQQRLHISYSKIKCIIIDSVHIIYSKHQSVDATNAFKL